MIRLSALPFASARGTALVAFLCLALGVRAADRQAVTALFAAREAAASAASAVVTAGQALSATGSVPAAPGASELAKAAPAPVKPSPADEIHRLVALGMNLTDRPEPDYPAGEIAFWEVLNAPHAALADTQAALLGLAHLHRQHGELTKAAAIYERYLADYPGDTQSPDALLELGRTLRDMGAYKSAISRFYSVINSTLKVEGNEFDHYQVLAKTAQFEIAETHFAAGEYDEANKYYTKFRLLDIAPSDRARAQFKAADALRRNGSAEEAATALRAFIDQWPDDENSPEARYLLALTLRDLKRPQEAFAVALDLLRSEKARGGSAPRRWLHWQLVTGNQLANEFFDSGDVTAAQTIYSSLLEIAPDNGWRLPITYQLGLCYERLGMIDRARESFKTVLDLAGAKPAPEVAALTEMAAWQIDHLAWRDQLTHTMDAFFHSTTGQMHGIAAPPQTAATP